MVFIKIYIFRVLRKFVTITGKLLLRIVPRNSVIMSALAKLYDAFISLTMINAPAKVLQSIRAARNIEGIKGVNVAGYINAESGVGEAARANIRALEKSGLPFALNNISSPSRQCDHTYTGLINENPYSFNLIHANPDNFQTLLTEKGIKYFVNRYNIGFWVWELSAFPLEWVDKFDYFNEIWTPSNFCLESITKVSPIPVIRIPHSVVIKDISDIDRTHFGINSNTFVFLFIFDFLSIFERKNPLAVIKAFKSAFCSGDDALLILKCSNSTKNPSARDTLVKAAEGFNVKFIDTYLNKEDLYALMSLSNCYISLHRSEGFGLTMAEAMYLKKPVIATSYSANTDFMNDHNSFLVRFKLVEIEEDVGPYKKGNVWADPDIEHAAEIMRLVYEKRDITIKRGEIASNDIKSNLSPLSTSRKILQRLEQITKERHMYGGKFLQS